MRIVLTIIAIPFLLLAVLSFGYGVFTLVSAELISASNSAPRIDPAYAIAWLLVSLILFKTTKLIFDAADKQF